MRTQPGRIGTPQRLVKLFRCDAALRMKLCRCDNSQQPTTNSQQPTAKPKVFVFTQSA
jgi:hypothetical protein